MSTFTETIRQTFHVVTCYTCGVPFGITSDLYRRVVTDANGGVYCPACGKVTCWQESDDQKRIRQLKSQLETEKRRANTANRRADEQENRRRHAERSLTATRGVVTRMKNRVGRGVCPCCNRHFENLAKHMQSKHPDYAEAT